jgi:hypothetical protein
MTTRPTHSESRQRTKLVHIRFSPEELQVAQDHAGLTPLSTYLRDLALTGDNPRLGADWEVRGINTLARVLDRLSQSARDRVLQWATRRYSSQAGRQ